MAEFIDVMQVDYSIFADIEPQRRKQGQRQKYGQPKAYADTICAFDIETTRIKEIENSVMYIWQFAIKGYPCIIGRTWDEFLFFLDNVDKAMKPDLRLVVFVHNLSYEWQFLSGIYHFREDEVFATDNRKILYCRMKHNRFEFRCSYRLSNTNLKTFLKDYKAEHQKISGEEFNYDLQRFPWTELSDLEMEYCVNDVIGLVEAVDNLMKAENDNYYSLPYTSTGYVRRDVKEAMFGDNLAKNTYPDYETYQMLKWAFRGGDTHANRWYAGKILNNVSSYDRSSSYPDVMINRRFPVTPWRNYSEERLDLALDMGFACLIHVLLIDVKLRDKFCGNPYIPLAKCKHIKGELCDNGRVLSAEHLEICCTDIDYRILREQYFFIPDVITLKVSDYGELPQSFKDVIIDLYRKKTELKGVEDMETEYALSKTKINACYGMSVQDPVKQSIVYRNGEFMLDERKTPQEILESGKKKAFLPYAVGVWVTAWARKALFDGIKIVGQDNFVYCDTDSIKFMGEADFSAFNDSCLEDDKETKAWATDKKGVNHYMGVYEEEEPYTRFATIGAKKYAYEDTDGKLHITIAGVNKVKGAEELAEHGGLETFVKCIDPDEEFVFQDGGGLDSVYNDIQTPFPYSVDGRRILITSNVCLRPSTYTLGITQDYLDILQMCEMDLERLPVV